MRATEETRMGGDSEYEPRDSRNVEGTAASKDGRWTNQAGAPPLASGTLTAPPEPEEAEPLDARRSRT
ncbi:MAG TPA: hypothetical protein VJM34_15115 [Novosphingobium sp.]|nr:hypothetical protein [Novosphingobium sp.]